MIDHDRWIAKFIPEHYSLRIASRTFVLRFAPVMFFEHYNEEQLHALVGSKVWDVSFAEEAVTSDGRLYANYGTTGKGSAFKVLGSVAHAVLGWAQKKKPDYLLWWSLDNKRQRLYAQMIRYFEKRGSGWQQLAADPFTGKRCRPEMFWLKRTLP